MTKQNNKSNNVVGKVIAGITAIGAGVLAVKILNNQDTRKEVEKKFQHGLEKGKEVLTNLKDAGNDLLKQLTIEFEEMRKQIEANKDVDFKKEIESITKTFAKIKDSNDDNLNDLVADVKKSIEKLKNNFENSKKK